MLVAYVMDQRQTWRAVVATDVVVFNHVTGIDQPVITDLPFAVGKAAVQFMFLYFAAFKQIFTINLVQARTGTPHHTQVINRA